MEVAILVPLIVFSSLVIALATPFYFRHRNQRILFEAIKETVEKTGSPDPALVEAITAGNVGPNVDLRRGILLLALAAAIAALFERRLSVHRRVAVPGPRRRGLCRLSFFPAPRAHGLTAHEKSADPMGRRLD